MKKGLEKFKEELAAFRPGRANPGILEGVVVSHRGARVALSEAAQVTVKDPRTLMVIVNDETLLLVVDKAIRNAGLGLNPLKQDAAVLRVPIPPMTKEFKESIHKKIGQYAERTRVHIRNVRKDAKTALRKIKLSDAEKQKHENDIQLVTDACMKQVEDISASKLKDIDQD
ncbi:ribosome recycling factor [Gaertneriomyces semiglobifer]|nr:ribosome recycling factor [Gaertneriomyces semiglobifer]